MSAPCLPTCRSTPYSQAGFSRARRRLRPRGRWCDSSLRHKRARCTGVAAWSRGRREKPRSIFLGFGGAHKFPRTRISKGADRQPFDPIIPLMPWSPTQYLKFEDERTRPPRDLLARVPLDRVANAVDLGCGPGNSTELLVERFGADAVSGLDNDAEMLAAAQKRLPRQRFLPAEVG